MRQRILSVTLAFCLCVATQSVAHAWQKDPLPQEDVLADGSTDGSDTSDDVIAASQEDPSLQEDISMERSAAGLAARDNIIPTPTEVYDAMIALKDQEGYKEGTTWTNDEPYSDAKGNYHWKGGPLDGKNISAAGCVAFAFVLSDTAFGELPARMCASGGFTYEDIKVGDILRMNNDVHTVIVLEVNEAGVVIAEGNNGTGDHKGKVHWGRTISKDDVMKDTSHYITRYPEGYISPDDPEANKSIGSGTLEGGLTWNLTKAGTLTISGSGAMPDLSGLGDQPWIDNSGKIRKVVIGEGVTNIGSSSFWDCGVLSAEIPSSVTTIGNYAFRGSSIISVTIPSSVKTIGDSAFDTCKNLRRVAISEGVETINQNAFKACTSLISIDLPASIGEVGAAAFYQCTAMTNASFAPSAKQVKLGDNMFTGCYYLMGVNLPKNIDRIGMEMFQNCLMLSGVEIPQGAESIGERAFASSSVSVVVIPDSVRTIGIAAFSDCPLSEIYFTGTKAQWDSINKQGDTAAAVAKVTIHYDHVPTPDPEPSPSPGVSPGPSASPSPTPSANASPSPSASPSPTPSVDASPSPGVTASPSPGVTASPSPGVTVSPSPGVTVSPSPGVTASPSPEPDGDDNDGDNGSDTDGSDDNDNDSDNDDDNDNDSDNDDDPDNDNNDDDTDDESRAPIAKGKTFTTSKITYKVTKVGKEVELTTSSSAAAKVTVNTVMGPDGVKYKVTSIRSKALQGNKKMTSLTIGANVKTIKASAFSRCTKLRTVVFGKNVTSIGAGAFKGCTSLRKTLTLPDSVKTIGESAFAGCDKITAVTIGKTSRASLTTIGKSALNGCKRLNKVTVRSTKLASVGKQAFKGTGSKLKVKVPSRQLTKYRRIFKKAGLKTRQVIK